MGKSNRFIKFYALSIFSIVTVLGFLNGIDGVYAKESLIQSISYSKIQHCTYSLKNNYLGLKNIAKWNSYIDEIKGLNFSIIGSNLIHMYEFEIMKLENMVSSVAAVSKLEKSYEENSHIISNVPVWTNYISKCKYQLNKVDKDKFGSEHRILTKRIEDMYPKIEGIIEEYKVNYLRVENMVIEAEKLASKGSLNANKKIEEAKVEANKLQSHPSKYEIIKRINNIKVSVEVDTNRPVSPVLPEVNPPIEGGKPDINKPNPPTEGETIPPTAEDNNIKKYKVTFNIKSEEELINDVDISVSKGENIIEYKNGDSLENGDYRVTIIKEGYEKVIKQINIKGEEVNETIVLQKKYSKDIQRFLDSIEGEGVRISGNAIIIVGNVTIVKDIVMDSSTIIKVEGLLTIKESITASIDNLEIINKNSIMLDGTLKINSIGGIKGPGSINISDDGNFIVGDTTFIGEDGLVELEGIEADEPRTSAGDISFSNGMVIVAPTHEYELGDMYNDKLISIIGGVKSEEENSQNEDINK